MSNGDHGDTREDLDFVPEDAPTAFHRAPSESRPSGKRGADEVDTDHALAAPAVRPPGGGDHQPPDEQKKTEFFVRGDLMRGRTFPDPPSKTGEPRSPDPHGADAHPAGDSPPFGAPATGPGQPGELDRTKFYERGDLVRPRREPSLDDDEEELATIVVDGSLGPMAAPKVDLSTHKYARPGASPEPARRSGRSMAIAVGAACLAVGVGVGVAASLLVDGGDDSPQAPVAEAPVSPEPEEVEPEEPEPEEVEPPTAVEEPPPEPEPVEVVEVGPTPAELIAEVDAALLAADPVEAGAALERARAELEAGDVRRLEAELMVLRGDGALAIERLTELTATFEEASLFAALGRVLMQAELDPRAQRAFSRSLEIDPQTVDAHLGLAHIRSRALAMPAARRHLREGVEAAEAAGDTRDVTRARIAVAEAAIEFEAGNLPDAERLAREALGFDDRASEASFVLARVAVARGSDPERDLRAAATGRAPLPAALSMLAEHVGSSQACELSTRFLQRAPDGFDAPAMRRIQARCP